MPNGNVNLTVQDGGLGAAPSSSPKTPVVIGWSSLGGNYQLLQTASIATLIATFGYSEAVDLAAFVIGIDQAPVWFLRIPANGSAPTQGLVAHVGTGTSVVTVTGTPIDSAQVIVSVVTGGTIATADGKVIQISLDNGRTFGPMVSLGTAATYKIPTIGGIDPVGWTLAFAAGTLVAGDSYAVNLRPTSWAVADVETALTQLLNSPFSVGFGLIYLPGGALETDAVGIDASMVSMANGNRFARLLGQAKGWFDQSIAVSTVAGTTTVTVTTTTPHGLASGAVITLAGVTGITGVNGAWTIVVLTATTFTLTGATGAGSYVSGGTVTQTEANWIAQLTAQWSAFTSLRSSWGAGDVNAATQVGGPGPVGGRLARRSNLWGMGMRAAAVAPSEDLSFFGRGALTGCTFPSPSSGDTNVYHDERINPGLDAANFSTLWTFPDAPGVYVRNCRLFAPPGSDYAYLQYGRVMDQFCIAVRQFFLTVLGSNVRLDPSTGLILAQDRRQLQDDAADYCTIAVVNPGWSTAVAIVVSGNDAISSTKTLTVVGKCVPLGYIKEIDITMSFAAQLFTGGISPSAGAT